MATVPSARFSTSISCCARNGAPPGITIRPPGLSWRTSGGGTWLADAVTMMRSGYGLVGVTVSGSGQSVNTAFALHVSHGRVRLLNPSREVNCGITLKEIDDGR